MLAMASIFDTRLDPAFAYHINLAAQQILELQPEPGVVQKATPSLELHQKVDVAHLISLPSGNRAEEAHIACTVFCGDAQDLLSFR